ncbi:ubiquitin-protein ligase E3A [Echria macrotheca]|uniref:HECT-type E3 ubiquitin transferase n=1 Tax=Echria macrotheca TaxID=438768 RepID=A0AAJ0FDM4_9PEZI|nr:ubiquitin-protein ligase E3A [Echria macrotheca]
MTPETSRPADGAPSHGNREDDILAGLWEQARFARLPCDAPAELKDLVEDVENPKRVYAIHKASRRHNFQSLVQKYIVQLRDGCGADYCPTPTCFTCRRRIAGRAPIRRYNMTSARTLATYLATQDNPENGLCPNLRPPKAPPAAVDSLVFIPLKGKAAGRPVTAKGTPITNQVLTQASGPYPGASKPNSKSPEPLHAEPGEEAERKPQFAMGEQWTRKDYRSFAANLFDTVAFKMLEWLTPAAIEAMSQTMRGFQADPDASGANKAGRTLKQAEPNPRPENDVTPSRQRPEPKSPIMGSETTRESSTSSSTNQPRRMPSEKTEKPEKSEKEPKSEQQQQKEPNHTSVPGVPRRNSNAKVRTPSSAKAKRQLSIDPFATDSLADDPFSGLLRSPRANGAPPDKNARGIKTTGSALTRPISQLSSAGYFDDVSLEKMPPLKHVDNAAKAGRAQLDGVRNCESASPKDISPPGGASDRSCSSSSKVDEQSDLDEDSHYPQTLSRLNAQVVDFICDIAQDDGTAEKHMLEPPTITSSHIACDVPGKPLRRKRRTSRPASANFKLEWKLFVEQSLFYVLSDAQLALRSFTMKGQLYDSQTLWYCMLRMTRIAPSLVFHSLWMAAASLFAPPKSLQSLRSPTGKLFPKREKSLSNTEAGRLMSICLHALVAAAPLVTESRQLSDMSRIRSHGLTLAGSGSVAKQPASLCLQYEDAFSDTLALRLARRIFMAIVARRCYDEVNNSKLDDDEPREPDVLAPLFSQLDFLTVDSAYIIDFSVKDRTLHETRVPVLLLDWARAVMMNDWDGSPEVPGDGPFGGALALIEAMYKKRHELLLGDAQFRSEYFAERLDTVQMPVAWLSHTSTRQKLHLLDFPYIFKPATIVSYFRAINFSRMSRAFEESSSLKDRIDAVFTRSSLTHHHKEVLETRLNVATSKYLVLNIKRERLLRDTFDQLWRREERELMRPLKVHLGEDNGEEGFDSGGVQQEFFRMAVAEALNPDYGAFSVDERTRMTWFVPGSMEPEWKFEIVGLLVSLAVYNGLTLPVTFPKALYRKLLGEPVTELHHIADGWPDLAHGLTLLLEWDETNGSVEDVFARTYEFSASVFGQNVSREMRPSLGEASSSAGDEWPQFPDIAWHSAGHPAPQTGNPGEDEAPMVTNANRDAFVSDYIRYLTDISVKRQYEAFARGFRMCLHPKSLGLLTPAILQSIVEGVQEIDLSELKRYARYVGWDASHRTVKDFWSIVKRYDEPMKRKLLEFVTASDRVPVGGIKNVVFVLQRNGVESEPNARLPTSYTCYGTLLLPEYKDKETLREKLASALENAQGFGFA